MMSLDFSCLRQKTYSIPNKRAKVNWLVAAEDDIEKYKNTTSVYTKLFLHLWSVMIYPVLLGLIETI